jgi:hypothetical protein
MYSKDDVKELMKKQFGVIIDTARLAEEAVQLYLEELDGDIISTEVLERLPDPVIFQTYSYDEKSEWIIGIALEEETNNPLFLICLKDGTKVYEEMLKFNLQRK